MRNGFQVLVPVAFMLAAGCTRTEGPRYVVTPLAVQAGAYQQHWVRLDTTTGDMFLCGEVQTPPESSPPPSPGWGAATAITCDAVTTGKVINWNELKK